jgi:hypothetical protein
MNKQKVKLLSDHDVKEVVKFQQYLGELQETGATADFYRKYQEYMDLNDAELAAILEVRSESTAASGDGSREPRK